MKLWTLTPPRSNARVAAVIADAFASAKAFDPQHKGCAPRDVRNALRFAMSTDAGAYMDGGGRMMASHVQTAFAVYDPTTGRALAVFASPELAGWFLHQVQASGQHHGPALRVDPWDVPGEIFECEE